MIRGLPAVAAAAAVDHHPDRPVVGVDLHFDEVIAAADRAELRCGLVASSRDAPGVQPRLVDGDVLALADVGTHADRGGPVAEDVLDLPVGDPQCCTPTAY